MQAKDHAGLGSCRPNAGGSRPTAGGSAEHNVGGISNMKFLIGGDMLKKNSAVIREIQREKHFILQ